MYFLILISFLCAKDLQFLPLACLFFEVLALVITAVKQLWFLPEDKLAAHIKWQVFWPWVKTKTVGEGRKVCCAAFLLETYSEKGNVRRDPFVSLRHE